MTHLAGVTGAGTRPGRWLPGGNPGGPGTSGNDDAPDLPGSLAGKDAGSRREDLERIFRSAREHPET